MNIAIPLLVAGVLGVATAGQAAEDRATCDAVLDNLAAVGKAVNMTKFNQSLTILSLQQSAKITSMITKDKTIISGAYNSAKVAEQAFNEDYKNIAAALERLLTSIAAMCH